MKILYLNISEEPFKVMETGEKRNEYRAPSDWIKGRLYDRITGERKHYDLVKFTWGYGNRPFFIAKYKGFFKSERHFTKKYSTGFKVEVKKGDYIIKYGQIIEHYKQNQINLFNHAKEDAI